VTCNYCIPTAVYALQEVRAACAELKKVATETAELFVPRFVVYYTLRTTVYYTDRQIDIYNNPQPAATAPLFLKM
jgi:hypothetical protein